SAARRSSRRPRVGRHGHGELLERKRVRDRGAAGAPALSLTPVSGLLYLPYDDATAVREVRARLRESQRLVPASSFDHEGPAEGACRRGGIQRRLRHDAGLLREETRLGRELVAAHDRPRMREATHPRAVLADAVGLVGGRRGGLVEEKEEVARAVRSVL